MSIVVGVVDVIVVGGMWGTIFSTLDFVWVEWELGDGGGMRKGKSMYEGSRWIIIGSANVCLIFFLY